MEHAFPVQQCTHCVKFPELPWEKVMAVMKSCMQLDCRHIQLPSGAFTGALPGLLMHLQAFRKEDKRSVCIHCSFHRFVP